jgi:hypothetical protein
MTEYDKQAKDFLKSTDAQLIMQEIRPELCFRPLWATEDKAQHGAEYRMSLIRGNLGGEYRDYRFSFWGSLQGARAFTQF